MGHVPISMLASLLFCISGVKDTVFWFEVIFALIRRSPKFRVRLNASIGGQGKILCKL